MKSCRLYAWMQCIEIQVIKFIVNVRLCCDPSTTQQTNHVLHWKFCNSVTMAADGLHLLAGRWKSNENFYEKMNSSRKNWLIYIGFWYFPI